MVRLMTAAALALSLSPAVSAEGVSAPPRFAPSTDHARENAAHIFNAVHSAMRQWGSSLHHNGLGVMPATVPRGTLLYHGTRSNSTPEVPEWLAFEMEHSEGFARSWRGGRGAPAPRPPGKGKGRPPGRGPPGGGPLAVQEDDATGQRRLGNGPPGDIPDAVRGYFHTYRANRDLKLLYLDGMAAGKTGMGTLDTQDFLLRGLAEAPGFGEYERARDVCEIVKGWGLDGVIRMEVGFEAIYCDFFDGLDLVSVLRRPWSDTLEGTGSIDMFEWARAVGQRYEGIGGGRVKVDFGAMVSGFWYPLNVSNPNGRRDMPRLGHVADGEREVIVGRIGEVLKRKEAGRVDWQGVADMIVTRHGDRIEALADEGGEEEQFVTQVLVVTNTFVDYPHDASDEQAAGVVGVMGLVEEAEERCVRHFLSAAVEWQREWTEEDGLIYAAVEAVVGRICGDLYAVRGLVLEAAPELVGVFSEAEMRETLLRTRGGGLGAAVGEGREIVRGLKRDLDWSMWKKCKPGCGVGEICFVAMWPFGLKEDHYHPRCHNQTSMEERRGREEERYWEEDPRPFA